MKDITPILQSLGLLDSEIKTYMAALESGPGTVVEHTKKTGLSRQATYVAIESLGERGLMSSVLSGKKRLYAAEPPSKLLAYAHRHDDEMRERITELERIVPEMELQLGGERPVVKMFEGKEGLRAIIEDYRESMPDEIYEFTDRDAMYSVLTQKELEPLRNALDKINAKFHSIYITSESSPKQIENNVYLPKKYGTKTDITIYGNKVALVTFEGKMHSVLIESPALAATLRFLFSLAMKEARNLK